MCGLVGLITGSPIDSRLLQRMNDAIRHRGPDDDGIWSDSEAGVGFAHRRLSIIELSPLGHQPMTSSSGRFVLIYNGEIYNHGELRTHLEADHKISWRGHSDTETLIECIAAWGLKITLQRTVGMFALALWDRHDRVLYLARDRFGEKPLYYGWVGGDFVFASELKAVRRHPGFKNDIDLGAVRSFFGRSFITGNSTIYQHIYKLEPGSILKVEKDAWRTPEASPPQERDGNRRVKLEHYWSYRAEVLKGLRNPIEDEEEALELLDEALSNAIRGQAVADVPVGAFLSGGIDSSTVVALYQKHSTTGVKTFSIGFEEAGFNEAVYAKEVAHHLGTEHYERYISYREAQEVIPKLPSMYDEPFADSSQIPTHLVNAFAREQVTVALSGDGGDELFGGYRSYLATLRLWSHLRRIPASVRGKVGAGLEVVPEAIWDNLSRLLPAARRPSQLGWRLRKVFHTMQLARSVTDVADSALDQWAHNPPLLNPDFRTGLRKPDLGDDADDLSQIMFRDAISYLPDDILCKVDRAAMAVSLETRIPFLDHRVAELASRIPSRMKVNNGTGKVILRRLLGKHVPQRLIDRPKAGFSVPVGEWIKGPLRPWAEELLDNRMLEGKGILDARRIRQRWEAHLSGSQDSTQAIWSTLMFQAWLSEHT